MSLDPDTKPAPTPHLPFGEAGLTDDLFKAGAAGRLLFWVAVAFSVFQLVTGFNIPLDKDFWPGRAAARRPARAGRSGAGAGRAQGRMGFVQAAGRARRVAGRDFHGRDLRAAGALRGRVAQPGAAHHACRIPVPGGRARVVRQPRGGAQGGARAAMADRRCGIPRGPLSVAVLLRPGAALRRSADAGHRRRRGRTRDLVRAGLAHPGPGSADHGGDLPGLLPVRQPPAGAARSSRLRRGAGDRAYGVRHRGHLRHADAGVRHLHLPVHPVRLLHGTGRRHPLLQRDLDGGVRPRARRAGQGVRGVERADGHGLRLRRRQRRRLRPVHHPADEALRISRRRSPAGSRRPPRWAGRSCRR